MSDTIAARLADRGIELPEAAAPAANYLPYVQTGNLLFISGQLPLKEGKLTTTGLLGKDVDVEAGGESRRNLCDQYSGSGQSRA